MALLDFLRGGGFPQKGRADTGAALIELMSAAGITARFDAAGNLCAAPSAAQDPIFDHANGIKVTVTASAVVFTPAAGCTFVRASCDVDTFIRTDDVAAADAAGAVRLIANQPEILPVTGLLALRAYCPTSAVLRITPLKVRP